MTVEDLEAYVKGFPEKALGCCDLVAYDVLIDVSLDAMMKIAGST